MAMIPDYSIGFTISEVEELHNKLKLELHRVIAQYSEAGTQVIAQRTEDIHVKMAACQKAMQKLDPTTYGTKHKTAVSVVSALQR
tara:strand:+ start:804 stop:1058 length:255 start_codon:yes stop_codon:yes gene_type:complete